MDFLSMSNQIFKMPTMQRGEQTERGPPIALPGPPMAIVIAVLLNLELVSHMTFGQEIMDAPTLPGVVSSQQHALDLISILILKAALDEWEVS
jgi:hypothetical protein